MVNQFKGYFGDCPYPNASPENPACLQFTGEFVISISGFLENWITVPIVVCVGWAIAFYLGAWLFLALIPVEISVAQSPESAQHEIETFQDPLLEQFRE